MKRLEELGKRIDSRDAVIGVIGLGYVGLPMVIAFAKAGFKVIGFDLDAAKVACLNEGCSYIEDVPDSDIAEARAAGRLETSVSFDALASADVVNVCVPTPLTKTRDPEVSHIVSAVEETRKRMHSGQLVILGSTT